MAWHLTGGRTYEVSRNFLENLEKNEDFCYKYMLYFQISQKPFAQTSQHCRWRAIAGANDDTICVASLGHNELNN